MMPVSLLAQSLGLGSFLPLKPAWDESAISYIAEGCL